MLTKLLNFGFVMLTLTLVPTQAFAFSFGFVRVPDYLDTPILYALISLGIFFVTLKMTLPKGSSYVNVEKDDRTAVMSLSAYLSIISLVALMGMLFVGMGLQRFAEV